MSPARARWRRTGWPAVAAGTLLASVLATSTAAAPALAAPPSATASEDVGNTAPAVPSNLSTYPPTPCGTATSPTRLPQSVVTAKFTARISDPDGNSVAAVLEIRRGADDSLAYGPSESALTPWGGWITWPAVREGFLTPDETVYYYQGWAVDSHGATSPTTDPCYFVIDGVDPGEPTVTVGTVILDVPTPVTFTPATGDEDIAGYRYGFDNNVSEWVSADATGAATIRVTVTEDPYFPGLAVVDLWVKAVDTAGNERAEVTGPIRLIAEVPTS